MIDDSAFLVLVGAMLLLGGLIAVVKVGMWVWLVSRVTHRPLPPREETGSLDGIKKLLAVVSTALGIVATCVGLARECGWILSQAEPVRERVIEVPVPREEEIPVRWQEEIVPTPTTSMMCCTPMGNCVMVYPAPVGSQCFCAGMMGAVAGMVCAG